ncbi:MAG: hypothetical protein IT214_07885 [Chitinophagaceae bacterium]|nr:hypothetical protein [Chitinophagaceae bacterium]
MNHEPWINTPEGKVFSAITYVNTKFSEDIPLDENNPEHSKIIEEQKELGIDYKDRVIGVRIDYNNEQKLNELFNGEYGEWAKGKTLNSEQLFAELEIEIAQKHLKNLSEYKHDNVQNYYYAFITAWIEYCTKRKESRENKEQKTRTEQQTENDFILSTIEDWLFEFKEKMCETDYQTLVSALRQYFDIGTFPTLSKPIQISGRPNKKLFGWALNRIFESQGKGIEKELLLFAKKNISLFEKVQFDENNIMKSNLYKYFTTQTK